MQTTMTNIWQDVYSDYGLLGIVAILFIYSALADRYPVLKWWMPKNGKNGLTTLLNNHIEHLKADVNQIKFCLKRELRLIG